MNLGMGELIFIFVLALLILGPKRLPEVGHTIGKALSEFKRATNGLRESITTEFENVARDTPPPTNRPSTPEAGPDLDAPKS